MTREEAISLLTQVKKIILGSKSWLDSTHQPIEEAFNMAIEALANTPNALDCISRQAAIDAMMALQAEDDEAYGCRIPEGFDGERAKEVLEQLPSAQPEIIRCKDCKHYKFADNRAFGFPVKRCEWTGFEDVDDDDFCSYAERKEQDDG